jgi:1-acyl-sn-glycerol-3-phosphate acyltransferase
MEEFESVKVHEGIYSVLRKIASGLCHIGFRVHIEGKENIPKKTPYILSPIHRSNIDFFLMSSVCSTQMRFMAKDSIFKGDRLSKFFYSMGTFPVTRGKPDRESFKFAEKCLLAGDVLVLFPEGTRQHGDKIAELFDGAALLSLRTNAPLIPIGIAGSEKAMPKGSKFIHPTKIVITIGKPVEIMKMDPGKRIPRSQVTELTQRLYDRLQTEYDNARLKLEVLQGK